MQPRLKGRIEAYCEDVNAGTVICEYNNTYLFSRKDWNGESEPQAGLDVNFRPEGDRAVAMVPEINPDRK